MRKRKRPPSVWERARVGDRPLFHDPELQRAYWEAAPVFETIAARRYVDAVFQRCAAFGGFAFTSPPRSPGAGDGGDTGSAPPGGSPR